MADEKKARPEGKGKGNGKGKALSDRKRLGYLKIRSNEVRAEMQAIKEETAALRKKIGAGKNKGEAAAKDDDGED
jgi:hypothetical protein